MTKNMHYYFNKEYFDNLVVKTVEKEKSNGEKDKVIEVSLKNCDSFKSRNENVISFQFTNSDSVRTKLENISGYNSFELYTAYPGLLMGIGYAHDLKNEDAIKCGFSFDYVSGLPYLPASSLKGALRSYFPDEKDAEERRNIKADYIKSILPKDKDNIDITGLRDNIFNNGDIFLDVFPIIGNDKKLLQTEYITPHKEGKFKNPKPIKLIKIKPNVQFQFCFLLNDYEIENEKILTKAQKLNLFKQIILDMGVGAKTNVGFGQFQEKAIRQENETHVEVNSGLNLSSIQNLISIKPRAVCRKCGAPVKTNRRIGKPYDFCEKCASNRKK